MIGTIFIVVFCLAFIEILIARAIYEAEDTPSSRHLVHLLNVVVVPFLAIFGLLLVIKIVGWL
jgi:hypothetical protein